MERGRTGETDSRRRRAGVLAPSRWVLAPFSAPSGRAGDGLAVMVARARGTA